MTTSTSGAWIPGVGICQSMGPQTQRRTDNTRGDLHLPLRAVQCLFSYNFLFVYGMERTDVSEVGDNTGGPRGVGRPFEISGSTTIHTVPLGVRKCLSFSLQVQQNNVFHRQILSTRIAW